MRSAAFLDRDGTLIEDAHYLADAARVRLVPGVSEAVRRLNDAGILTVVVTNQSGIALGLLTEAQYAATAGRLAALLAADGARLDASYHCPHHPDVSGPCDCRKPGTGLYRRAAADLGIDLTKSLYVGDRHRDVAPGIALGGFARLVPSDDTPPDEESRAAGEAGVSPTLGAAVDEFLTALRRR
jgi:histidinol-phosphate phosphatase family protein